MQEVQETHVQSLDWEDPLEKDMAAHSIILAWKIPWTEEPGGLYSPWGRKKLDMTYQLNNKHNPYLFDVLLLHLVLNFIRHFPA